MFEKIRKCIYFLSLFFLIASTLHASSGQEMIELGKTEFPEEYNSALKNQAEVAQAFNEKTFFVFWKPENYSPEKTPLVVSIHGHGGWAIRDFFMWYPFVKERGYALLCVQWWKGTGEKTSDYLTPSEIYPVMDHFFKERGIKSPALLHGFSRGSANSYPLAGLDVRTGNRFFDLFIANAGQAEPDYPPNKEMANGKFGSQPLQGTRWITVAGGKDPNPDRSGIPGMRRTKDWIERYGGEVVLAIEDPEGNHGVFHKIPKNVNLALDEFEEVLKK